MSAWRKKAIELYPEDKREIELFFNRIDLWMFLNNKFLKAYREKNDREAMKVVGFYRWCVSPNLYPLPNDLQTDAAISFLEDNTCSDEGLRALFKYMDPNEILHYSHLIAYAHKLSGHDEVLKWLCGRVKELNIIVKCDEINRALPR